MSETESHLYGAPYEVYIGRSQEMNRRSNKAGVKEAAINLSEREKGERQKQIFAIINHAITGTRPAKSASGCNFCTAINKVSNTTILSILN